MAEEELPDDVPLNWRGPLYAAVIGILGAALLTGIIGYIVLTSNDKTVPDGLIALTGTVAGALVGVLAKSPSG